MAYFAQLNSDNLVQQVISVNNSVVNEPDYAFPQTEPFGQVFINQTLKIPGTWKQTSFNKSFRKNYAGIGYTYDSARDAFIPPKPFPSWILNEETCLWESPTPYPQDGGGHIWDEESKTWVVIPLTN